MLESKRWFQVSVTPALKLADAYSPKCQIQKCIQNSVQTSKIEHIVKIVISLINSILDVRLGSEYASEIFF